MTVVVDLGCHTHKGHPLEDSVIRLFERFHPDVLFGFDPHPDLPNASYELNGTAVHLVNEAAWIYYGEIAYEPHLGTERMDQTTGEGAVLVPCFDLAEWLKGQRDVILKMDVESAEYVLLPHLIVTGADQYVKLLLIEWHGQDREAERAALVEALRCEVEPW